MFYQNLAYLCDNLGITRSNVCKKLGLSENAWKRWENESTPRKSTVLAISRFFGVSPDDLLHTDMRLKPQKEDDESVKSAGNAYGGSNPPAPTNKKKALIFQGFFALWG